MYSGQLLLKLGDPLRLLLRLSSRHLLLLVLARDVGLLPSALGPSLEQVGAAALLS